MKTLTVISWSKGLSVVSLIDAIKRYSTGSLVQAKAEAERLLAGEDVTLGFPSEVAMARFREEAEALGAIFEQRES